MRKIHWSALIISVLIAELVGVLAGLFAGNSGEIYRTLILPPLSPPGWVFPVVWIILYAVMGIAAYLIYDSDAETTQKRKALNLYGAQLFINFLWPIVFFRFEMFGAALGIIVLLIIFVSLTIKNFLKINKIAAWIMLPYLFWIIFATYLNTGVFFLN